MENQTQQEGQHVQGYLGNIRGKGLRTFLGEGHLKGMDGTGEVN